MVRLSCLPTHHTPSLLTSNSNNCTKHQVRCDYMDAVPSDTESLPASETSGLELTPRAEETINTWQQTGNFPFPELDIYPLPQPAQMSKTELQFINNLASISSDLAAKGVSRLTLWTDSIPKSLSLASTYPFVMHALHSFSANNLAWTTQSAEVRQLSIEHGGIALRGLHEAIGNFSKSNADGVLSASLILVCQATDWRSWSSLEAGIQSVCAAMDSWKHESLYSDFITNTVSQTAAASRYRAYMPTVQERLTILQDITTPLQQLLALLGAQPLERSWVEQLLNYISRLQACEPAVTPEEQFSHSYVLRKWLYWVPVQLLRAQTGEGPAMLVVAHLYATALALTPLFPDIGTTFYASIVGRPLEELIQRMTPMQGQHGYNQHAFEIAALLRFPTEALSSYRERNPWARPHTPTLQQTGFNQGIAFDIDNAYVNPGNLSPAFAPSQLHLSPTQIAPRAHSPFLEVPTPSYSYDSQGFGYGVSQWGAAPSPSFPPQEFGVLEDESHVYGYDSDMSMGNLHGGFVPAPTIWA